MITPQNANPTHGGAGRCAVGVVAFGVGRVACETRGGVWERHGQVRVVCARKNTEQYKASRSDGIFCLLFFAVEKK